MIKCLTVASALSLALSGAAFAQATAPGSAPVTQAPIAPADQNGARMESGGSVMAPKHSRHTAQHHRHMHHAGQSSGAM